MSHSEKIEINGSPEQVWAHYADVSSWKLWDVEVKDVYLDKGLTLHSKGFLQARNGPKAKIQIVECEPNSLFTVESKLPFCVMNFQHYIVKNNKTVEVEHSVIFSGLLAPLFSLLIGSRIYKSLPNTLDGLKKAVEGM